MENKLAKCAECTCVDCKHKEFLSKHYIKARSFIIALSELLDYDLIDEAKALVAARYDWYMGGHEDPKGGQLGELVIRRFDNRFEPKINHLTIQSIFNNEKNN